MMEETVEFIRMENGSYEDYQLLDRLYQKHTQHLPDELLAQLKRLGGDKMGYKIDRYEHSLQTATRAFRAGEDEEVVVIALLHDIGDIMAPENHSDLAAAILQPYISKDNHWLVKHHGIFQGYYFWHHMGGDRNAREQYRGHPLFERVASWCHNYDQNSFDPNYENMPIEAFEPMVRRIIGRKAWAFAV
jgi:predicted HD phosphohydrolase